ncbi:MAG: nuclear transport factor 2 family protein [Herpetosiphon sp.]
MNTSIPTIGDMVDRLKIRELLENWVVWRDAGDWERFATVWHDDGRMIATWFQAGAAEFIAGCRRSFEAGIVGLHCLGGTSIDVNRSRAIAQTKMQIVQRGQVHGVLVDVTCLGRFLDALEKRDGRWGIVLRHPVYELDRMATVEPCATLALDPHLLHSFPEGYQHLAYLQTQMGFQVSRTLPGTRGPEIEALSSRMRRWLDGGEATCLDK